MSTHPGARSRIAIGRHPLHPMLVVFPLAFLLTTPLADLALWWSGDVFWARVAWWMLAAGCAAGVIAALAGLLEFVLVRRVRQRLAGWTHLLTAVMALAMAGANFTLRLEDPVAAAWPWGMVLSVATAAIVAIAGWIGGTLTFGHGIGTYVHPHDSRQPGEGE